MMEKISLPESPKRSIAASSNTPKDFRKVASKTRQIQAQEEEEALVDFLKEQQIPDTESSRNELKLLIEKGKFFDDTFSFEDLSESEILEIRENESLLVKDSAWQGNKSEAQTAETLIDQWKAEGFSNYETLQKLLNSHEAGEVTMLADKYEQFKQFLALLQNNGFAGDTAKIIGVINTPGVDLSSPQAFDKIIFTIFEDESISQATKDKISKQFKLFPIRNGDDLKENLYIKQNQIKQRKNELEAVAQSLESLETEKEAMAERLTELKQAILTEKDMDKRLKLEKEYDELEEELERIKKETEQQEQQQRKLQNQKISDEVLVRGARAKLVKDEIIVTIPESDTKVAVPASLENENIGKAVNAYLVNELFKKFGLESYFFYQSDFTDGSFPYPPTLESNDLLLFRLGFSNDGQILKNSEIKDFEKCLVLLMNPEKNRTDKTLQENATAKLDDLGLIANGKIDQEIFAEKLNQIKRIVI